MSDYDYDGDDLMGDPLPGDVKTDAGGSAGESEGSTAPALPVATTGEAEASTQPAEVAPQPTLSPDVLAALQQERLAPLHGETDQQALMRLTAHMRGAKNRFYNDFLTERSNQRAAAQELQEFRAAITPMLTSWYQQQQQAQREQAMAQIPDPEVAPQEHDRWLLQQLLRRDLEREQRDAEAATAREQQAQEETRLHQALGSVESVQDELEAALANDATAAEAYKFATQALTRSFSRRYPTATPDQITDLVVQAQTVDMMNARSQGIGVADLLKWGYEDTRALLGVVGQASAQAGANGNGNGHVPTPAAAAAAAAAPPAAPKSPAVAAIARQRSQAQARAVVSPTPPASAPSGEGIDPFGFGSEEEFLDYALSSPAAMREINGAFQAKKARTSWRGDD